MTKIKVEFHNILSDFYIYRSSKSKSELKRAQYYQKAFLHNKKYLNHLYLKTMKNQSV
ncbi:MULTISPECIES: hypothetical protein [Bacillaceae]|uniref:Uncharacterized protein n=1 Tax=Evansella alkalicola TaxID=745819 RepID=A0ABS6JW46_9BACI|nr:MULTISPECIES: hypothetical protein [Bacillaceae]MBU9722779.1 hypothetical protein [Bacillus alkalicola]